MDRSARETFVRARLAGFALLVLALSSAPAFAVQWRVSNADGSSVEIVADPRPAGAQYYLERRLKDGSPDPRFGPRGRRPLDLAPDGNPPTGLRLDSTGRILVVATAKGPGTAFQPLVLRFLATGANDLSWGNNGRSSVAPTASNASALDALPLPDGRVLVLGLIDSGDEQAAAWHLAANGELDGTNVPSSRFVLYGAVSSRGVSLSVVDARQVVLGLRVQQGDDMLLEAHAFDPTEPDALPQVISRQLWPPAWTDAPVWLATGGGWRWVDPANLAAPSVAAVRSGPRGWKWVSLVPVTPAAAIVAPEPGGAVYNPFPARAGREDTGSGAGERGDWSILIAGAVLALALGLVAVVHFRRPVPKPD